MSNMAEKQSGRMNRMVENRAAEYKTVESRAVEAM